MIASLRTFGEIAGDVSLANQTADQLQERWQGLQKKYTREETVNLFYQIWHKPLFTVNSPHIIEQVINACGGRNIFSDQPKAVFRTQLEAVIAAKPEAILFGGSATPSEKQVNMQFWQRFPQLPAVKNSHLIALPMRWLHRPSPRLLKGAEFMCEQLQQVRQARVSTNTGSDS